MNYKKLLRLILWAVAVHSLLVGLVLILATNDVRVLFGFKPSEENFFQTQGGVFHVVMAIGYAMAAFNPKRFEGLIIFTIVVKLFAAIFLLLYYILVSSNCIILLSCITDLSISLIIFLLYHKSRKINIISGDGNEEVTVNNNHWG